MLDARGPQKKHFFKCEQHLKKETYSRSHSHFSYISDDTRTPNEKRPDTRGSQNNVQITRRNMYPLSGEQRPEYGNIFRSQLPERTLSPALLIRHPDTDRRQRQGARRKNRTDSKGELSWRRPARGTRASSRTRNGHQISIALVHRQAVKPAPQFVEGAWWWWWFCRCMSSARIEFGDARHLGSQTSIHLRQTTKSPTMNTMLKGHP